MLPLVVAVYVKNSLQWRLTYWFGKRHSCHLQWPLSFILFKTQQEAIFYWRIRKLGGNILYIKLVQVLRRSKTRDLHFQTTIICWTITLKRALLKLIWLTKFTDIKNALEKIARFEASSFSKCSFNKQNTHFLCMLSNIYTTMTLIDTMILFAAPAQ